jgi:uncharacterized protein YacL|uniref:Uncharacterized protein n=1 Tax=uncultured microorganism TaxID=358574 RepID=A0A1L3KS61_9ZZZZ|nr:hypothetical protein [uncultured microorganism]
MDNENGGALGFVFTFFFMLIIIVIGAYVASMTIHLFPVSSNSPAGIGMTSIYKGVFGGFNFAFVIFLVIALLSDLIVSAMAPSIPKAIENLIMFFVFVYVGFFFKNSTMLLNVLNANTLVPTPYAFFSQNYFIILVLVFIALSIVLNFRRRVRVYDT